MDNLVLADIDVRCSMGHVCDQIEFILDDDYEEQATERLREVWSNNNKDS